MDRNVAHLLDAAHAKAAVRDAATPRIDYANANKEFRRQKGALTRAQNSGDPDKVVLACAKTVREWSQPPFNGAWPDDWSRWQRALDDALPWNQSVSLEDLN